MDTIELKSENLLQMNAITFSGLDMTIPFPKLVETIQKLNPLQRFELLQEFEDEFYRMKFENLLSKLRNKNDSITLDEITAEVELVRQQRYEKENAN